jgi:hypothetical protein
MLIRTEYEQFIYALPIQFPSIHLSTLVIVPPQMSAAELSGLIALGNDIVLCVNELLDFAQGLIITYRYEVTRSHVPFSDRPLPEADRYCRTHYSNKEKLYWYDSWPHPNNPELASTHPHHKHIHPDIKHHRIPAPGLRFDEPNLPFLISEIERNLLNLPSSS